MATEIDSAKRQIGDLASELALAQESLANSEQIITRHEETITDLTEKLNKCIGKITRVEGKVDFLIGTSNYINGFKKGFGDYYRKSRELINNHKRAFAATALFIATLYLKNSHK